jgi:histidinol-phosphate aminotransferase
MFIADSALDHVAAIPAYEPGTPIGTVAREYGIDVASLTKLASNENPLGMSPAARAAAGTAVAEAGRYPDAACFDLTNAIAARMAAAASEIIVGAGSADLIVLAARAFLGGGRTAVLPQYSFAVYANAVRAAGATAIVVPAKDYAHDLEAMAAAIDGSVRIVFLASVNNPTGMLLLPDNLERFFAAVPEDVLIILDEAYREYAPPEAQGDTSAWRRRYPNLLVLRTFSKIYGLAGLRVGYGIGHPRVIEVLRRLQNPFSVNAPAQSAAIAALDDTAFVERSRRLAVEGRAHLAARLNGAGFETLPSAGNFVLVRVGDGPLTYRALLRKGVIVRPVVNYGLSEWIRVTVGLPRENDLFLKSLEDRPGSDSPAGREPSPDDE